MTAIKSKRVAQLQKRARDKEYRLRRAGASESAIAAVSPRVSPEQINKMTPQQLAGYAHSLNAFNQSRRYTSLESGQIVETARIKRLERSVKEYNKRMDKTVRNLIAEADRRGISQHFPDTINKLEDRYSKDRNSYQSRFDRFRMTERPKSVQSLKSREKTLQKMNRRTWGGRYRKVQKSGVVKALYMMGYTALGDEVRRMSDMDFDLLVACTDFVESLYLEYSAAMIGNLGQAFANLTGGGTGKDSYSSGLSMDAVRNMMADDDVLNHYGLERDKEGNLWDTFNLVTGNLSPAEYRA